MAKQPKKRLLRWIVLYSVAGIVDLVQIIIDFTGAGIAVSEVLELIMPFVLVGLLLLFKIPLFKDPKILLSILGATGLDALTGGAAPFWILDVWYLHTSVKNREAMEAAAAEEKEYANNPNAPLYRNGVGQPRIRQNDSDPTKPALPSRNPNTRPLNADRVRSPSGRA